MASRDDFESGEYLCDLGDFAHWLKHTHRSEFRKRWKEYRKWYKSKSQPGMSLEQAWAECTAELARQRTMMSYQVQLTPDPQHPYRVMIRSHMRSLLRDLHTITRIIKNERTLP